jgi:RNA polymerase sigma-70 factor (ECF subfamily)
MPWSALARADSPPLFGNGVLVVRAQLGDLRALDRLLQGAQAPLYRHIWHILGDEHAAEDVLQEVLLTVSRKIGALRDPAWFRAWAFRIATRLAIRHAGRARRLAETFISPPVADIAVEEIAEPFDAELLATLATALDDVPPASQLVLRMHYMEGLTHVEVAEALDISTGTVKSRLSYGLAWLRKVVRPVA